MKDIEVTFSADRFIVSKTDLKGMITYCNDVFIEISGYEESELLGKPHNILRHPDMPKSIFKLLWDSIKSGKEIFAFVKNLTKDGSYYWVLAHITSEQDERQNNISYNSTRRCCTKKQLNEIIPLYNKLLEIEKSASTTQLGIQQSSTFLKNHLDQQNLTYDEFIFRFC